MVMETSAPLQTGGFTDLQYLCHYKIAATAFLAKDDLDFLNSGMMAFPGSTGREALK